MSSFINANIQYPEEAKKNNIEGTVYFKIKINQRGNVIDTKIISGLGYGCDTEATRVIRLLKFIVPKNRLNHLYFNKHLQVHFRLPSQNQENPTRESIPLFHYTIPQETKQNTGYQFTIQFNAEEEE